MSNVLLRVATLEDAKAIFKPSMPLIKTTAITLKKWCLAWKSLKVDPEILENFRIYARRDGKSSDTCMPDDSQHAAFDYRPKSVFISLNHQRNGYL